MRLAYVSAKVKVRLSSLGTLLEGMTTPDDPDMGQLVIRYTTIGHLDEKVWGYFAPAFARCSAATSYMVYPVCPLGPPENAESFQNDPTPCPIGKS